MAGALRVAGAGSAGEIRQYDESRPDFLITGFGPFPRVAQNPSGVLALALARGWALRGWKVAAHVFETAYASVARDGPALARREPRAVLMLGVATRAKALRVELRAINRRAAAAPDALKRLPSTPLIAPGGPAFRAGRHRGAVLRNRLRAGGVAARLSRDAGRYLCNFAYWQMLAALPSVPVIFIHVPTPRDDKKFTPRDDRKFTPRDGSKRICRPSLRQMEAALRHMLRGGL